MDITESDLRAISKKAARRVWPCIEVDKSSLSARPDIQREALAGRERLEQAARATIAAAFAAFAVDRSEPAA